MASRYESMSRNPVAHARQRGRPAPDWQEQFMQIPAEIPVGIFGASTSEYEKHLIDNLVD
jgi:hypothetical protein